MNQRCANGERSVNILAISFFDLFLVAILGFGLVRGRKHGMSGELLGLIKWVVIVFGCAMIYLPAARLLSGSGVFTPSSACLLVYLAALLVFLLAFAWAGARLKGKLVGSDAFGRAEYYLGMASGVVRVSCMLLVGLALLNARQFTPADVKAMQAFQDAAFGTRLFPTLHTFQVAVFEKSLTGPIIQRDLGFLLIQPSAAEGPDQKR